MPLGGIDASRFCYLKEAFALEEPLQRLAGDPVPLVVGVLIGRMRPELRTVVAREGRQQIEKRQPLLGREGADGVVSGREGVVVGQGVQDREDHECEVELALPRQGPSGAQCGPHIAPARGVLPEALVVGAREGADRLPLLARAHHAIDQVEALAPAGELALPR